MSSPDFNKRKKKTGKILLLLAAAVFAAAAVYYFIFESSGFKSRKRIYDSAEAAYLIYNKGAEKRDVYLFFGDIGSDGLKKYKTYIPESARLEDNIKQALALLTKAPPRGMVSTMPEGVVVKGVFMDSNNILYVDFSEEITLNHKGGTTGEYLTVYSVVDTVFYNFPQVKGVRILIDDKTADTIAGHIDISGILLPESGILYMKGEDNS